LELKVLDLNATLQNLEKMLCCLIGEDIELVFLLGRDLGSVKVDPGQIEQVIMNLAVNARDAMPKRGKLTIETANVELDEE
jgi:two-component system cell cycle sensor histidine kinase/response regulator CckA